MDNFGIVGLNPLVKEIEYDVNKYAGCNSCVKPCSIILNLDPGEGRTKATEYISDMFNDNNVLDFTSSLYDYYEMNFTGEPKNMKDMFKTYDTILPTFSNSYKLVLSINLDKISERFHEKVMIEMFINKIKEICKSSFVVFFVSFSVTKKERELIDVILNECKNVKEIKLEKYTSEELKDIFINKLSSSGFYFDEDISDYILQVINSFGITEIKKMNDIFDELLKESNISMIEKRIGISNISSAFKDVFKEESYVKL